MNRNNLFNKFTYRLLISTGVLSFLLTQGCSQPKIEKISDTVIDERALVLGDSSYLMQRFRFGNNINGQSFQQDAILSHKGYQYVGYYDEERHVCIARRSLPDGTWSIIRFMDYLFEENDAHNTISLGICPNDGTIHVAFDMHARELHYRVSEKGIANHPDKIIWSTSLFGPVTDELEPGKKVKSITYPRFIQTPGGELQLCYRMGGSGNGTRVLADYNSQKGHFENTRVIDSGEGYFKDQLGESTSRNSYPNGYTYCSEGKLHVTWVWRESAIGSNHDLNYAYSEDQGITWRNNSDELLDGVPSLNSPEIKVVDISRSYGLMNTHGQTIDSEGRVHVVMWHCTDESLAAAGLEPGEERWGVESARKYHHYWRDTMGEWHHNELPGIAGNRPKVFASKDDDLYLIFGSKSVLEEDETKIYFEGDLVIMSANADKKWTDWKVVHAETGPYKNEMLADVNRWQKNGILSIMVQEGSTGFEPSALRILDFKIQ